MSNASVYRKRIISVFRSSVRIRRVTRASLAWISEMAQICRQHRRVVHGAAEEANDTKLILIET
jgi:hypothetical protein